MSMPHTRLAVALLLASASAWADPSAATREQGIFRGRPVTYLQTGSLKLFEGDILLDHVAPFPTRASVQPEAIGVAYPQYLWPEDAKGVAEIPYIITSAAADLSNALTAFNKSFAGVIQFVPRGSQADYVDFDFDTANLSGQCESYVGRIGGEQMTGGSGACSLGTLLHEMGHVVGLYHEQSRPDRNIYVTVNFGNVIKGSEGNFNQPQDNFQDLGLFDYGSIMEYLPFAFTRNGDPVIETIPAGMPLSNLTGYTAADIDGVKRLYGKFPNKVTVTSNPPGLSVMVDGAEVTTPASFSWALKSTHTLAVPASAQTLGGGTYVYGRWNDSTLASHSITVAGGNNMVTQPGGIPAVTVYTANFIQLSAYSAKPQVAGTGSVSVSPSPKTYAGAAGSYFVARQPVTLTADPASGEAFVTWGGTSAPSQGRLHTRWRGPVCGHGIFQRETDHDDRDQTRRFLFYRRRRLL
jgi:astacin